MADDCYLSLKIWTEKIVGHGEDAPPLLINNLGKAGAVGVFDGMGGAGATVCDSSFGDGYTKAFVASRLVAYSIEVYLNNHLPTDDISVEDMKAVIKNKLNEEKEKYPPKIKSSLRSKLVRDYPTTIALVTFQKHEEDLHIDSYWAGDSHCYLWNKDGFSQISKDDLEEKNDPMENLHNDSPISNCVCSDRDFVIHHKPITLAKEPVIILCATDGCFGYYQTPMHFKYILKVCLQNAKNEKEWKELLQNEILEVTGDDCSLSLMAIGFSSFDELKNSMKSDATEGMSKLVQLERDIADAEQILVDTKHQYEKIVTSEWEQYKKGYMKYIIDEENGNA